MHSTLSLHPTLYPDQVDGFWGRKVSVPWTNQDEAAVDRPSPLPLTLAL